MYIKLTPELNISKLRKSMPQSYVKFAIAKHALRALNSQFLNSKSQSSLRLMFVFLEDAE